MNGEIRKHYYLDEYVIMSPDRKGRPQDFYESDTKNFDEREYSEKCPFCKGNEQMTESVEGATLTSDWNMRVVKNKYPSLEKNIPLAIDRKSELFNKYSSFGYHEVIIESPLHNKKLFDLDLKELASYLELVRKRYVELQNKEDIEYVSIFKNAGHEAGASLKHAHTQMLASAVLPGRVKREITSSHEYYEEEGTCPMCDVLSEELKEGIRIVAKNEDFVAFCPYASIWTYETTIVPRTHISNIGDIGSGSIQKLAEVLYALLVKYRARFGYIPYNMVFFCFPMENHNHFRIDIYPRLKSIAGLEHLGLNINEVYPEKAAEELRESEKKEK